MARLTHDYHHEFHVGPGPTLACRVRVYDADDATVIVVTDPDEGPLARTALAVLATALARRHVPDPARPLVWVEHHRPGADTHRPFEESYELVTFARAAGGKLEAPHRRQLDRRAVELLIGGVRGA